MKLALLFLSALISATAADYQLHHADIADLGIAGPTYKSSGHYRYAPVYLHRPIYRARRYVVKEPIIVQEGAMVTDITEPAVETIMEPVPSLEIINSPLLTETSDVAAETVTEVLVGAMVEQGPSEDSGLTPPHIYYRARRYVTAEESAAEEEPLKKDNAKHEIIAQGVVPIVDEIAVSDAPLLVVNVETATDAPVMEIAEQTQAQDPESKPASKLYYRARRYAVEQQAVAKEVVTTPDSEDLASPLLIDTEIATEAIIVEQDALAQDAAETPAKNYHRVLRYAVKEPLSLEESIAKDVVELATEAAEVIATPEDVNHAPAAVSTEHSGVDKATEIISAEVKAEQGPATQTSEQTSSKAGYKTKRYTVYKPMANKEESVVIGAVEQQPEAQVAATPDSVNSNVPILADSIEMTATEIPVEIITEQAQAETDKGLVEAEKAESISASKNY